MSNKLSGRCNCGQVRFEFTPDEKGLHLCHCKMCQRAASGPFMGVTAKDAQVTLHNEEGLAWWASSDWGERGFCRTCGATLFWRLQDLSARHWVVSAGALEACESEITEHIFVDSAPNYYAFADDAPRLTKAQTLAKFQAASGDT